MERNPKISVILPVYNGEKYLRGAIESVIAQTYEDFELIIWNDSSTDDSEDIIASYSDTRIRRFSNSKNLSLFRTLNHAVGESRAELIRLWAQDDVMMPDCLAEEVEFHDRYPHVGMGYCLVYVINEDGQVKRPLQDSSGVPDVISSALATQIMFYHGSITGNIANVMLKKSVLEDVGLFREDMLTAADFEMWVRISGKYPIGFVRKPVVSLRDHDGQFSRRKGVHIVTIEDEQVIYETLMNRLPPALFDYAKKYNRWRRYPMYVHYMMRCLLDGDFNTAAKSFRFINARENLALQIGFWFLSANQHLFSMKPKYLDI